MSALLSNNLVLTGNYTPTHVFNRYVPVDVEITGLDIDSCSQYGKAVVRLQGSGFSELVVPDIYVEFGGSACLFYEILSDTEIALVVPAMHSETYPAIVDVSGNLLGYTFTLSQAFTYTAAPALIGGLGWTKIRSADNVIGLLVSDNADRLLSFELPVFEGPNELYVYRSLDNGGTWQQLDSIPYPIMSAVEGVWGDANLRRVTIALTSTYIDNGGIVYYSGNSGSDWVVSSLTNYLEGSSPKFLNKLVGSSSWKNQYAILGGDSYLLVRSEDYGQTWIDVAFDGNVVLYDVDCSKKDGKYVVLSVEVDGISEVYVSSNYGATFAHKTGRPAAQIAGDADLIPAYSIHFPVVGDLGIFQLAKEIARSDNRFNSLVHKDRIEYAASSILCSSAGDVAIVPRSEIIGDAAVYYYYTSAGNKFSPANVEQVADNINFGYCGFSRMILAGDGTLFGVAESADPQLSGVPGIYVTTIHTAAPNYDIGSPDEDAFGAISQASSTSLRWPWTLPGPQMDSLALSRQDNVIRSQTDTGPVMVRRRFTAATRYIKLEWLFTHDQLLTFEQFFINTLNSGVSSFLWPVPTETKDIYNIAMNNEANYENMFTFIKVRFKGPYEHKRFGGTDKELQSILDTMNQSSIITGRKVRMFSLWVVSAELEILPY